MGEDAEVAVSYDGEDSENGGGDDDKADEVSPPLLLEPESNQQLASSIIIDQKSQSSNQALNESEEKLVDSHPKEVAADEEKPVDLLAGRDTRLPSSDKPDDGSIRNSLNQNATGSKLDKNMFAAELMQ